jgi:hypothetical protein
MKQLNDKLDGLSELVTRIDAKILDINTKLDELIKALHEYDDDQLEWPEPNDALKEAAAQYNEKVAPCRGHDAASWNEERMDIIGQNGNEGIHYVSNEEADEDAATFNDYGMRVVIDKSNNSDKHTGVDKKRNNELPDFKHTPPPPPKPKRRYYKPKNNK